MNTRIVTDKNGVQHTAKCIPYTEGITALNGNGLFINGKQYHILDITPKGNVGWSVEVKRDGDWMSRYIFIAIDGTIRV